MGGQTGQKCEFFVKTSNAGTGIMHIQIDGPSKVTLDAYEVSERSRVITRFKWSKKDICISNKNTDILRS